MERYAYHIRGGDGGLSEIQQARETAAWRSEILAGARIALRDGRADAAGLWSRSARDGVIWRVCATSVRARSACFANDAQAVGKLQVTDASRV